MSANESKVPTGLNRAYARLSEKGKAALFGNFRGDLTMPELLRGLALLEAQGGVSPVGETATGAHIFDVDLPEIMLAMNHLDNVVRRPISRARAAEVLWRTERVLDEIRKEAPAAALGEAELLLNEADLLLNAEEGGRSDYRDSWEAANKALALAAQAECDALGERAGRLAEEVRLVDAFAQRIVSAHAVGGFAGGVLLRGIIKELEPRKAESSRGRGKGYERR